MAENISGFPTDTPSLALQHGNLCSAAPRRHQGSASSGETPGPNSAALLPQGTHTWRRDESLAGQMVPPRLGQPPAGDKLFAPPGVRPDSATLLCVCVRAQSCLTLCDPLDCSPLLRPRDFPGKSTGVGCHFFLQRLFLAPGVNLRVFCLLRGQADSSYTSNCELS